MHHHPLYPLQSIDTEQVKKALRKLAWFSPFTVLTIEWNLAFPGSKRAYSLDWEWTCWRRGSGELNKLEGVAVLYFKSAVVDTFPGRGSEFQPLDIEFGLCPLNSSHQFSASCASHLSCQPEVSPRHGPEMVYCLGLQDFSAQMQTKPPSCCRSRFVCGKISNSLCSLCTWTLSWMRRRQRRC